MKVRNFVYILDNSKNQNEERQLQAMLEIDFNE